MNKNEIRLKRKLISMFQENTGTHMLDSGGAYGRNWERNQKLPKTIEYWDNTPVCYPEGFRYGELWGNVSLYHHLAHSLAWDDDVETLNKLWDLYDAFYPDKRWHELEDKFIEHIQGNTKSPKDFRNSVMKELNDYYHNIEEDDDFNENVKAFSNLVAHSSLVKDLWYCDFGYEHRGDNSYNYENNLSQVFQYEIFGDFVFIEIHGGCDVRGGYTRPVIFKIIEDNFYDGDRYTIYCTNPKENHYWDWEGGNYWGTETDFDPRKEKDLLVKYDDLTDEEQKQFDSVGYLIEEEEKVFATEGQAVFDGFDVRLKKPAVRSHVMIFKDGEAFCPICGHKLAMDKYWSM